MNLESLHSSGVGTNNKTKQHTLALEGIHRRWHTGETKDTVSESVIMKSAEPPPLESESSSVESESGSVESESEADLEFESASESRPDRQCRVSL